MRWYTHVLIIIETIIGSFIGFTLAILFARWMGWKW